MNNPTQKAMLPRLRHWLYAMLAVAACLASGITLTPNALAAGDPMVSGSIIRDFARITFYWPGKVGFNASIDGTRLTIRFDRQVNPDFSGILGALHPYVTRAELLSDRKAVAFTLKQPYQIRTFITETETGVDILKVLGEDDASPTPPPPAKPKAEPKPELKTAPAKAAPKELIPLAKPKPEPKKPEPKKAEPKKAEPKVAEQPAKTITPAAAMATAAPAPEKKLAPPAPTAPTSLKRETTPPAEAPQIAAPAAPTTAPAEPEPTTPAPAPAEEPTPAPVTTPAPATEQEKPATISGAPITIETQVIEGRPTMVFSWNERVAAAVWQRGSVIWALFNKPATVEGLPALEQTSKSWLLHAQQLPINGATLLRFETSAPLFPVVSKNTKGYGWMIGISADSTPPENAVKPDLNTSAKEPFLLLPVPENDGPFTMQDPDVGDLLKIVPVHTANTGISPARSYADLSLLETAQGIVVAPIADQVEVQRLRNGVRMSAPGGLFLSTDLSEAIEETPTKGGMNVGTEKFKATLFPAAKWQKQNKAGFDETKDYILHEIIKAPTPLKKNEWRKKLAELYLSEGMEPETLGVLSVIRQDDSEFFRAQKLAAYEGAAHLMSYHSPEAAMSFASTALDDEPEADLLRKAVAATLDAEAEPVPYMEMNDAYIRQYPLALRQRIAIIAANHAIRKHEYIAPLKIFDSLQSDNALEGIEDYVTFLRANIAAEVGREKEAEAAWKSLADKMDDRQFRARAEYAMTLLQLRQGSLQPQDAIARLDKLRIVWRGDDLEMSLLTLLGQLNVNLGNYWDGLKAWEELLQFYPNTPEAIAAYGKMSETFRDLFLNNAAKDMPALQALALYNEFKELTPIGSEGDKMVQNLVDRLVEVDLLEQAAARLETQVQTRLQGQEKSVIGARLALIHLLNREPASALAALQNTRVDNVPASLSLERNRLAAKALLEFKKPEQALSMIEGDYSPQGEAVRLEAFWAQNDWANVIDMIELKLAQRKDPNAAFTPEEGQQLLRLALSYIFLGEYDQLSYLRRAYGEGMKASPYAEEFMFLTQERVPVDHKDFKQVAGTISGIESFMDSFRKKLDANALSNTIAAPAANEPAATGKEAEKTIPDVGQDKAATEETEAKQEEAPEAPKPADAQEATETPAP